MKTIAILILGVYSGFCIKKLYELHKEYPKIKTDEKKEYNNMQQTIMFGFCVITLAILLINL